VFIAIIVGAGLGLSGASNWLPKFFSMTVKNLGDCMGPVAMLLTGMVVGGYEVKSLLKDKKIYIATALRLFVLPAFFIVVLKLLGADQKTLSFTLFALGTALGLNTVVFPSAYGGDTKTGASMAMISHVLSVITIPLMYLALIA
jgi:predicted permease